MTPALAILELSSIARAVLVSDALVKQAPIDLMQSRPVSSGKHILVFGGEVAAVDESFRVGKELAADALVDQLYLPYAHAQIGPLLGGHAQARPQLNGSVAVVETTTVCSTLLAADAACKAAEVTLIDLRLAVGIGGKAFFTMTGELYDIEAAVEAATGIIDRALLVGTETIANPHDDIKPRLIF